MNPIFIFLFLIIIMAQDSPKTLDDFRWKNRVVLYFPQDANLWTTPDDSISSEIEDRKIKYFVIADSVFSNAGVLFSPEYIKKITNRYKMGAKKSSWVLIGLDGGAKVKKEEELNWDKIFKSVDAMPMRQSEIRKKGGI